MVKMLDSKLILNRFLLDIIFWTSYCSKTQMNTIYTYSHLHENHPLYSGNLITI